MLLCTIIIVVHYYYYVVQLYYCCTAATNKPHMLNKIRITEPMPQCLRLDNASG